MADRKEYYHRYYMEHRSKYKEYNHRYFQENKQELYKKRKESLEDPEVRRIYNEKQKHYRLFGTSRLFN